LEQAKELRATTYALLNRNVSHIEQARQIPGLNRLYRVAIKLFREKLNVVSLSGPVLKFIDSADRPVLWAPEENYRF